MATDSIPTTTKLPSTTNHYEGPRPHIDQTGDFYVWQQQIRLALEELKHIGSQQPRPSGHLPHSFQQAMRELYGTSHFRAFISSRAWQQAGLEEQAEQEIQRLQQLLNNFEEPDTDDLLATDPDWQAVLTQVEIVTALLR